MRKITGITVGLLLVVCGVWYMLGEFGIADISFSLDGWWTLFIIIPSFEGLVAGKDKVGSTIGLLIGVLLLLAARDVLDYGVIWKIAAPSVVVMIGVKMIVKSVYTPKTDEDFGNVHMAVCTEKTFDYADTEFTAAKIGAVFGGTKCNLTNAKIKDGDCIDLACVFGGAEIVLPENVNLKCNAFCLFGGINDKRAVKAATAGDVTINVNGFCIFGGADIK